MKSLYLFLFAFCLSFTASAQLPDGSIAPNFTTVDINGNTHTLYDYLNEGKVVVIDIFATWCPPCWNYHQSHALSDAYDLYGPAGTDQMMIFGVEGDNSTNSECLYNIPGCNSTTLGDWVTGVPYPLVEDSDITSLYQLPYWPIIYVIYPDRRVYEMGQAPLGGIEERLEDIPTLSGGINPNLFGFNGYNGGTCEELVPDAPYYGINNLGETEITSVDIKVTKNEEVLYEEAWTGSAAPFELITEIQIPTQILTENTVFNCELANINGDASEVRNFTSSVSFQSNNVINVHLNLTEDDVTDVTRYEIQDESNTVVASYVMTTPGEHTQTHYLPATGCHTIWVYEGGADGMEGSITANDGNGVSLYESGEFVGLERQDFNVASISSVNDLLTDVEMALRPNPVDDLLTVSLDLEELADFSYSIIDITGKVVLNNRLVGLAQGQNQREINVSDLSKGLYILNISNENGSLAKKFVKN